MSLTTTHGTSEVVVAANEVVVVGVMSMVVLNVAIAASELVASSVVRVLASEEVTNETQRE
jgi:hypothetical protein